MQKGEAEGKRTQAIRGEKDGRQEKHQISQKYTRAVCKAGSGNKVVKREKLQSEEKTLLGNGKIKTEGDM